MHITNEYIDRKPVLGRLASETGMEAIVVQTGANPETGAFPAEWVLLSVVQENFRRPLIRGTGSLLPRKDVRMWTDDYSSLFGSQK